jgi:speckle-type POZ protein
MENACATSLTDAARLVQLLKINGYSASAIRSTRENNYNYKISSRWHVDGYEWEIRICPDCTLTTRSSWALKLIFLGSSRSSKSVRATLCCRFVDPRAILDPSEEKM